MSHSNQDQTTFSQHLSNGHRDALLTLEEQVPIVLLYSYQFREELVAETLGMMIANTVGKFSADNVVRQQPKTNHELRAKPDENGSDMTQEA